MGCIILVESDVRDAQKFAWTGPFKNAVLCWLGVPVGCAISGMDRTVQVLAAHCLLKRCSYIVASPGARLAPALSLTL